MKTSIFTLCGTLAALILSAPAVADPSGGFSGRFEPHENKTFHLVRPSSQGNVFIAPGWHTPRNTAQIRQRGRNLSAAVGQVGVGNRAFIGQTSNSSDVTVTQNGNNNISNVFIFNY